MHRSNRHVIVALAALVTLVAASCSEPADEPADGSVDTSGAALPGADCADGDLLGCAAASTLEPVVPSEASAAAGEPVVIGMMNVESSPAGSYPELSEAVSAASDFVNAELGGLDGRPVEVTVCNTGFSAEGSAACGQQFVDAGVVAVLGGIDVFGDGIGILAEAGVPFVGGIPISDPAASAPTSFQWSGGTWGATIAFADHAEAQLGAERVAIVYGEFGPITQAAQWGRDLLEARGVQVDLVPSPVTAADLVPAVQAAASAEPDAMILLGADTGCSAGFDALATLEVRVPTFHTGACAAPELLERADPAIVERAIFNVEGSVSLEEPDPDTVLYGQVVERYGDGLDPVGAGTVSFRSFMNLYLLLSRLGADATSAELLAELRSSDGEPSFMGHPYTCDGEQFAGLPAMCSPQQILVRQLDGELVELGPWIDVGALRAAAAGGNG